METLFEAEWRSVPPERMRSSYGICTIQTTIVNNMLISIVNHAQTVR